MMSAALIIAFVALLLLAAAFSALETALSLQRETQPGTSIAKSSGSRAPSAMPAPFLHEALLFGAVANLLLAAVGLHFVIGPLHDLGWNPWLNALLIFGLGMLAVEVAPRFVALRWPEATLRRTLPALLLLRKLLGRASGWLTLWAGTIVKMISPKRAAPLRGLVLEEVETLIEMREESGSITAADAAVLQEIITLHGHTVKDCMTPRVDLPLMPHDADDDEAQQTLESARFRHVLVFDERADTVTALIDTQAWRLAQRPHWKTMQRPPVFVPETMFCLDALRRHLPDSSSAVVIVDEYGGFEGMLERRNIVERLLGKAAPSTNSPNAIVSLGKGRYMVNGAIHLDEICRELDVTLTAEGVDTIGGLVFNRFGYLPKPGERIEIEGIVFKVKRTGRNRIQQLEIWVKEETREDAA